MTWPTTDMYTTVQRSLYHTLMAAQTAAGTSYPIFTNQVDKKKVKDSHGAISIMKTSDVPDFGCGGGQGAHIRVVATTDTRGNPDTYTHQPWPDTYDLIYQLTVTADNPSDMIQLENIVRIGLPPRRPLYMWDSNSKSFTEEFIEYRYAGYIPRDIPTDNIYNRVFNIHCEAKSFIPVIILGAIKEVQVLVGQEDGTEISVNDQSAGELIVEINGGGELLSIVEN